MSDSEKEVLSQIKVLIRQYAPDATAILYGSRARGNARSDSDWDILILLDQERITFEDRNKIVDPLYDLSFEVDELISVKVYTLESWKKQSFTLFYKFIEKEGIVLQTHEDSIVV